MKKLFFFALLLILLFFSVSAFATFPSPPTVRIKCTFDNSIASKNSFDGWNYYISGNELIVRSYNDGQKESLQKFLNNACAEPIDAEFVLQQFENQKQTAYWEYKVVLEPYSSEKESQLIKAKEDIWSCSYQRFETDGKWIALFGMKKKLCLPETLIFLSIALGVLLFLSHLAIKKQLKNFFKLSKAKIVFAAIFVFAIVMLFLFTLLFYPIKPDLSIFGWFFTFLLFPAFFLLLIQLFPQLSILIIILTIIAEIVWLYTTGCFIAYVLEKLKKTT